MDVYRGLLAQAVENGMDPGLRSVMGAEDVIRDVLIAAYQELGEAEFPSEGAFRRWLETVVRDRLAKLARRHLGAPPPGPVPSGDPSPSSVAGRRAEAEALEAVLARIPPPYREVIRLSLVEGLPTGEIAARVGKSLPAVRKALRRALEACREAMRSGPGDQGRGGVT